MFFSKTIFVLFALLLVLFTPHITKGETTNYYFPCRNKSLKEPKVLTPLSQIEIVNALRNSYIELTGKKPSSKRLAMAWAQVAFENGHGKSIYNNNLGNIGPGRTEVFYHHSSITCYRSFDSNIEGGKAYWNVVSRCSGANRSFDTGHPRDVAIYLKGCGYYTADTDLYANSLLYLYNVAMTKVLIEERWSRAIRIYQDQLGE